jgi:hypothetical protein
MFKKSFFVFGVLSCLQLQAIRSGVVPCSDWDSIARTVTEEFDAVSGKDIILGLDCDGILCSIIDGQPQATVPNLSGFLERFKQANLPFFCMTAIPGNEYPTRRIDFERLEIASFFQNVPSCLKKTWTHENDDSKQYFIDNDWNTVYTYRTGSRSELNNPIEFYKILEVIDAAKSGNSEDVRKSEEATKKYATYQKLRSWHVGRSLSKGEVLVKLIDDNFLEKPQTFIFVDDNKDVLESIKASCATSNIRFLGIWCESYPAYV